MNDPLPEEAILSADLKLGMAGGTWLSDLRFRLLAAIETSGSLSAAARSVGVSYKSAWEQVEAMTNLADRPLVIRHSGGAGGGGARLTDEARGLIRWYAEVAAEHRAFLAQRADKAPRFSAYATIARRLSMNTSARNQYHGVVRRIVRGPVNAEVTVALDTSDEIVAVVTDRSVETLCLADGSPVYALVKASSVILVGGDVAESSARNILRGTVETLAVGPVSAEVTLKLSGGKYLAATITGESATRLALVEGAPATALINASSVILATN